MTRLPEPFLPLNDSDIKRLAKLDIDHTYAVRRVFTKASNRMGTARRCDLARLFLTLRNHQQGLRPLVNSHPEGVQIITRVSESVLFHEHFLTHLNSPAKIPDLLPHSRLADHFDTAIQGINLVINTDFEEPLIIPDHFVKELEHAGLL